MKTVNPGEIALRDQFRLSRQPMLHIVAGQRTMILITEVSPTGHLVRCWHKINFVLV